MKRSFLVMLALLSISAASQAQMPYPFTDIEKDRDIQAYWYNVPVDSVSEEFLLGKKYFHPFLQVYGQVPADSFRIEETVYQDDGTRIYENYFDIVNGELIEEQVLAKENNNSIDHPPYYDLWIKNGFFRLQHHAERLEKSPDRIVVTIESSTGKRTREIKCRYHKLSGRVTDFSGKPFRSFVWINPDFFGSKAAVWTDSSGRYEIELPERVYNCIAVCDENYGKTTLEAWAWHIIMDEEQRLDFKVGTAEVYNLNVWANNGGGPGYFISFRPMVLFPLDRIKELEYPDTINGKEWTVSGLAPDLDINDVKVTVNGKQVENYSLQKYLETTYHASPAYLIQVNTKKLDGSGKQTIRVEYITEMVLDGEKVLRNSMGYYQFFPNFAGMSNYF